MLYSQLHRQIFQACVKIVESRVRPIRVDPLLLLQAKINNAMQLGFSYQHELSNGVTMTASTLLEGKNFNAGGHKIGFGLDFDL